MGSRPIVQFKEVSGLWRSKTNEIHYVFKIKLPGIPSSVKIVERVHGPHEKWNKITDDLNLKPVRNSFNFFSFFGKGNIQSSLANSTSQGKRKSCRVSGGGVSGGVRLVLIF